MKTEKVIPAGRCRLVIRSSGHVYLQDREGDGWRDALLVATSPAGCHGLKVAFTEAEDHLRGRRVTSM